MATRSREVILGEPQAETLASAQALAERAPEPARVGSILFGTAGWIHPSLIQSKTFYPPGKTSAAERLQFYGAHFPLVEVDATYYSLLPRSMSERWLAETPPHFKFDIKAFPSFTGHPIDVARLPAELRARFVELGEARRIYPNKLPPELERELSARFLDFLEPLASAGRLGAILLQFPPWFTATKKNARAIELLRERYPELPFAIEFRHASWREAERQQRVLDLLTAIQASYVCIDAPNAEATLAVTNPKLAVVRFHGRNLEGFTKKGATVAERFNYLYAPGELRPWIEPLRKLASGAEEVHAVFNNCVRNYAVLNAKDLAALLVEAGPSERREEHLTSSKSDASLSE
jgi:uncharacterized protein YecE (DUF72 family)